MRTLLLNIGYEPIDLISWEDAVTLWYLGKVEILAGYDEAPIHSCYLDMPTPAVVRLSTSHHKYKRDTVPFERKLVYARDAWTCQYCGRRFHEDDLSFDHVQPQSRGGKTNWVNIVTACSACNNKKDDRTPEEAGMELLRQPRKPSWLPAALVNLISRSHIPPQWQQWVEWLR